jgi:membrane protein implicated in regulation of membrane protease activity
MEPLSFTYLLATGVILMGLEAIIFSFVLFPIGLGFLVVALLTKTSLQFETLYAQVATALSIGLMLIFTLRPSVLRWLHKSQSDEEEVVHRGGVGVVEGNQIKFEGTYWKSDSDLSSYNDGDKITVKIERNRANIAD